MPARTYDDEVFREKRKVKNPITFKLKLNEEQKLAKEVILHNTITLLAGKAGSGKTLLACQVALDGLFRRHYEKVIITRPTVSKEDIGFLPGDLHQKMDPWVQPIYQNMYALFNKEKIEKRTLDYEERFANPFIAAERGFLDDVIIPSNSRFRLIQAFSKLKNKTQSNPKKKFGNIPL